MNSGIRVLPLLSAKRPSPRADEQVVEVRATSYPYIVNYP
jgi:hypothetical protein